MKRRLALLAGLAALVGGVVPGALNSASAGPSTGGNSTANVSFVRNIPFEVGTATGANTFMSKGKRYLLVTSWKTFSIYDLADPLNPTLVGAPTPFGFKFENEDVSTNGRIMLFSEETPQNILHVWDIQNLAAPREIATLAGAGGHTASCIYDCEYSLGRTGVIVDLRRPDQPKVVGNWIKDADVQATGLKTQSTVHDVREVSPGLVLTASKPALLLDFRKSRTDPAVLAQYKGISKNVQHAVQWPRGGKDRFAFMSEEKNFSGACPASGGPKFVVVDTQGWQKSKVLRDGDTYGLKNGAYVDGAPPANALGCSTHWFEQHPTFKDGGLIALASYEHGARFLTVSPKGKITEQGWYVPWGGSTSAMYWVTDKIVYAVDYSRGIDVLQYDGKLRS